MTSEERDEAELVACLAASIAVLAAVAVVDGSGAVISGLTAACRSSSPCPESGRLATEEEKLRAAVGAHAAALSDAVYAAAELEELEARETLEEEAAETYYRDVWNDALHEAEECEAAAEADFWFSPRSALPIAGGGIRSERSSPCSSFDDDVSPPPAASSLREIEGVFDEDDDDDEDESNGGGALTRHVPFERYYRAAVARANAEVELALLRGEEAGVEVARPTPGFLPVPLPSCGSGVPRGAVALFDLWVPIFEGKVRVLVTRPAVISV